MISFGAVGYHVMGGEKEGGIDDRGGAVKEKYRVGYLLFAFAVIELGGVSCVGVMAAVTLTRAYD